MARPSRNNADHFTHDIHMRNDLKVKALRRKFGHMGYALWCYFMECLSGSDHFQIQWNELNEELYAADFDVECEELRSFVDYCLHIQLLTLEDGFIFSGELKARFEPLQQRREQNKAYLRKKRAKASQESAPKQLLLFPEEGIAPAVVEIPAQPKQSPPASVEKPKESPPITTVENPPPEVVEIPPEPPITIQESPPEEPPPLPPCIQQAILEQREERERRAREQERAPVPVVVDIPLFTDIEEIKEQEVVDMWHELCPVLPQIQFFSAEKRRKLRAVAKELGGSVDEQKQKIRLVFTKVSQSNYLSGRIAGKDWKANFDWVFDWEHWVKITEGNYDNNGANNNPIKTAPVPVKKLDYSEFSF